MATSPGGLAENMVAVIEAFGADRPSSLSLDELWQAMAVAITDFSGGGGSYVPLLPGLDPTGTADAAPIINAAISAASTAGGGTVNLPVGNFKLLSSLVPANNVTVNGQGMFATTLLPYNLAAGFYLIGSSGSPLTNFSATNFGVNGINQFASPYTTGQKGYFSSYNKECLWQNLFIQNCYATGFGADFNVDCLIDHVITVSNGRGWTTGNGGGAGIGIGTSAYSDEPQTVTNCISIDNATFGIFWESQFNGRSRGITCSANYCASNGLGGIGDAGCALANIVGNTCAYNTGPGIVMNDGTETEGDAGELGLVANNQIYSNSSHGIYWSGANPVSSLLHYSFKGNKIYNNSGYGIAVVNGTSANIRGIYIKGNDIYDCTGQGVYIATSGDTITDLVIQDNTVVHCYAGGSSGPAACGIYLANSVTNARIRGNICYDDDDGTVGQQYGLGVASGATISGNGSISDNDFSGNGITGIINSGTISIPVRNNLGFNPVGEVSSAVPSSGSATTALIYDATFYITAGATSTSVALESGTIVIPALNCVAVFVPAGATFTPTYSNAPTWVAIAN